MFPIFASPVVNPDRQTDNRIGQVDLQMRRKAGALDLCVGSGFKGEVSPSWLHPVQSWEADIPGKSEFFDSAASANREERKGVGGNLELDSAIDHECRTAVSRYEGLELVATLQCRVAGGDGEAAWHGLRVQDDEDGFLGMIGCAPTGIGGADEDEGSFVREEILLRSTLKCGMASAGGEERGGPGECRLLVGGPGSRGEG
jgi:hypothetical protein